MPDRPGCMVAVLTQGTVRAEMMLTMVQWAQNGGWHMYLAATDTKPTTDNRNRICAGFLEMEQAPDVLLMIDEDIFVRRCPVPLVHDMMAPDSAYDVVGLMCPTWRPDRSASEPILWAAHNLDGETLVQNIDLNAQGLCEVDLVGSGAILIRRRVLEHPDMRAPFMDVFDADGLRKRGHDYEFCIRAKAAGFRVWLARDYVCGHSRQLEMLDVARMQHAWDNERAMYERELMREAVMPGEASS